MMKNLLTDDELNIILSSVSALVANECEAQALQEHIAALRSRIATLEGQGEQARQGKPAMSDKATPATDAEVARLKQSLDDGWAANFPKAEVTPELLYSLIERIEADGAELDAKDAEIERLRETVDMLMGELAYYAYDHPVLVKARAALDGSGG